jgi:hypothetical protein
LMQQKQSMLLSMVSSSSKSKIIMIPIQIDYVYIYIYQYLLNKIVGMLFDIQICDNLSSLMLFIIHCLGEQCNA